MRIRRSLTALAFVALPVVAAAPAAAYDVDAYVFAAGHMLQSADVPKGLGNFGERMFFSANTGRSKLDLCSPKEGAPVFIRGGNAYYTANFSTGSDDSNFLSETVITYASDSAAMKAFDQASKDLAACLGTQTGSWDDGSGTTYTYSSTTTTGKVPMVTVTGVESVFLNTNNVDGSSTSSSKELRDQYQVMTLVGDAIIVTGYERADDANVSTRLRKKVNQAAFNAVTRWTS